MLRTMLVLLLLLTAPAVWAQDSDDNGQESTDASEAAAEDTPVADDEELYAEEDEDVFIPSEDVKFGQSIPFPTDI